MYLRVVNRLSKVPADFHQYGYEDDISFRNGLGKIMKQWRGKTGECVGSRNDFHCIRFRNQFGAYEDRWIPDFMVEQVPPPPDDEDKAIDIEKELDSVFGFD